MKTSSYARRPPVHTLAAAMRGTVGVALIAALALGCATGEGARTVGTKTAVGGLGGAAAGGLLGSVLGGGAKGVVAGVLIGGLIGGAVGNVLDQRDRELAIKTAQVSLERAPTGTTSTWVNPDSGAQGTFSPTRTYQQSNGQYCREYQQDIIVGGKKHQSYGTACRMPDGSWQIQS